MRKCPFRLLLAALLCASLMVSAALGEVVRGDLSERFDDIPKVEYEGTTYALRNRLTTVLLMGIAADEALGKDVSDFTALIVIDDNEKKITPVRLAGNLLAEADGVELPLREVYALGEDGEGNCLRMVDAVNGLLGEELIDDYFAFEIEGALAVDGFVPVEGDTEAQLRALKAVLETRSLDDLNKQYALLSDYIITDMKSGAAMKVADKAERYEMLHSVPLPTLAEEGQDEQAQTKEGAYLRVDEEAALALVIEAFYEESKW